MRDLYELFRDGVIVEAIQQGSLANHSPWRYIPKEHASSGTKQKVHVGRMQTMALIRRFMQRACREFPAGIVLTNDGFSVTEEFVVFVKTHKSMDSSHEDMVSAWLAMASVVSE